MCCKNCDFSAVTSAVFLPCFLFFLSPASSSHFILFFCKISMTVSCLFGGGVEAFWMFLVLLVASFEQSSFLTPLSALSSSTLYSSSSSSSSSSFSSPEEVDYLLLAYFVWRLYHQISCDYFQWKLVLFLQLIM